TTTARTPAPLAHVASASRRTPRVLCPTILALARLSYVGVSSSYGTRRGVRPLALTTNTRSSSVPGSTTLVGRRGTSVAACTMLVRSSITTPPWVLGRAPPAS